MVTRQGAPIRFRHALVRGLIGLGEVTTLPVVGVISMLVSTNDQRLGDVAAGTIVIRERAAAQMSVPVVFYPPAGWESFVGSLDVSAMTSAEYETVRSFLTRAYEMAPLPRANLAARLAGPLVARWHQPVPPGAGPELWLACVASAYQRLHGAPSAQYRAGPWAPAPQPPGPGGSWSPGPGSGVPYRAAQWGPAPPFPGATFQSWPGAPQPPGFPACGGDPTPTGFPARGVPSFSAVSLSGPVVTPCPPSRSPPLPRHADPVRSPDRRVEGSHRQTETYPGNAMAAYLDHAATTPMRPEASAAMLPWLTERFGNPSGSHAVARAARAAIDDARDIAAEALGVAPGGIIFTGGGTESDNLAIMGVLARRPAGGAVVCSAIEHHAVLHAAQAAVAAGQATGCRIVPVHPDGTVDLDRLADALDPTVTVVSIMLANNEVGVIQALAPVARLVRRRAPGAVIHTDAVQAFPWLDVAALAECADLISVSAHKFGGPQGTGVLAVRGDLAIAPLIHGGGQERDRRSGTHNVAGIVGMAAAMQATVAARPATVARAGLLRDRLADDLLARTPGSSETGDRALKVAGNCHLCFDGIESEALLVLLDDAGVYASAGSACTSGAMEPSHVLVAMGIDRGRALGSLRLSLGHTTTDDDVDLALKVIPDALSRLRRPYDPTSAVPAPAGRAH